MAAADAMDLRCSGLEGRLAGEVLACLQRAAANLELKRTFGSCELVADDLDGSAGRQEGWLQILPSLTTAGDERRRLTIHCSPRAFCRLRLDTGAAFAEPQIWEQASGIAPGDLEFLASGAEAFIHHHLLLGLDLAEGRLQPADLPGYLAESLAAAWAVTVDGRLARRGLPGFPLEERRAHFSRLFSTAVVLLPGHWEIFQSLWDGALEGEGAVLDAVRELPRL